LHGCPQPRFGHLSIYGRGVSPSKVHSLFHDLALAIPSQAQPVARSSHALTRAGVNRTGKDSFSELLKKTTSAFLQSQEREVGNEDIPPTTRFCVNQGKYMIRALTPKKQAELLTEFLTQSGVTPAHTQVLELVARMNGAPNWNALKKTATRSPENAFSKAVKVMLGPWAKHFKVESELKALRPNGVLSNSASILNEIYQTLVQQHVQPSTDAWRDAQQALKLVRDATIEVFNLVWKARGFNRVFQAPEGCEIYTLKARVYDEDSGWEIELDGDLVNIPDECLDELLEKAVVAEATVEFPRSDKYGVPEESTDSGMREWLWREGFAITPDICMNGEDRGDDGAMSCDLAAYLPAELVAKIRKSVNP
jgi:hypothetical protein